MATTQIETTPRLAANTGYLGRAFLVQYNVILLGGAVLFSLASASIIPLMIGVLMEALWLFTGPSFSWFRRWVDRQDAESARAEAEARLIRAAQALDENAGNRLLGLHAAVHDIYALTPPDVDPDTERALSLLERIEATFLDLCQLEQRLSRFLAETPQADLEREIATLNATFTAERDLGVRFTLRQSVKFAERRLAHRERVSASQRAIALRLDVIEKSVMYVRSQAFGMGPSGELLREVETLMRQIGPAAALEAEVNQTLEASNGPTAASYAVGAVSSAPR